VGPFPRVSESSDSCWSKAIEVPFVTSGMAVKENLHFDINAAGVVA
jgi:hypothetical protein